MGKQCGHSRKGEQENVVSFPLVQEECSGTVFTQQAAKHSVCQKGCGCSNGSAVETYRGPGVGLQGGPEPGTGIRG